MVEISGTDRERAKSFNRRVVVEALHRHGPCSRVELSRLTGLSPQTISNIIAEFLQAELVHVSGRRLGRGQPQVDLALRADAASSIGLSLEHDRLTGVRINLAGERRAELCEAVTDPRPAALIPRIIAMVTALRDGVTAAPWGVGLAMPGPFATDGEAFAGPTTLPGWGELPVADRLGAELGLKVLVERDAAAAARAEYLYGCARGLRSFFHLHFGRGLGGSAFTDGQPLRGAHGNAGEIGLMVVEPGGRRHPGGPDGCLEAYVSIHALQARLAASGLQTIDPAHEVVQDWIAEAALRLRGVIVTIEMLFDPEAIVIAGRLPQAVIARLIAALEPLPPSIACRTGRGVPRVLAGSGIAGSPVLGAAALPFYDWLAPDPQSMRKPASRRRHTGA
ncbi:ROK family transcriptional regulator [Rhodovastum atsumiense]|nr:ROK family transcriptional regulator [Rhodovastum atsumiense]